MNRTSRRKKRFLVAAAILLCLSPVIFTEIWLSKSFRYYNSGLLATYVSQNYMIDQQKATGKWPNNLSGLAKYLKKRVAEEPGQADSLRMQQALNYYQGRFVKFEMVKEGKVRCIYHVSTMDADFLCYSSTEGDASCQDAKSSKPFVFYTEYPDGHETTTVIDNSTVDEITHR